MSPRAEASNEVKRRYYAREARKYDLEMDFWERRLFGPEHRSWACSRAVGDTLEVAIGTALNLPYYPPGVRLTGIDLTPEMLASAATRAQSIGRDIDLREADAHDLPFTDASFDTVISTYAMCSVRKRGAGDRRDETRPAPRGSIDPGRPHSQLGEAALLATTRLRVRPVSHEGRVHDEETFAPRDSGRARDRGM
jgi:hypothetical protein